MASSRLTIPSNWSTSGRISAVGDTAVRIVNTSDDVALYVAKMDDDTLPPFSVDLGDKIQPAWSDDNTYDITLKDGERLFLATAGDPSDVTVMTGAA